MRRATRNNYLKKGRKTQRKTRRRILQKGGGLAFIKNIHDINLFTDEEMERYMNPIYGNIMCNTGYIPNTFYLAKVGAIDTPESNMIRKMCNVVPGTIQPKLDVLRDINAKDIGYFIMMKYAAMKHPGFIEDIVLRKSKYMIKFQNVNNEVRYPFSMAMNKYVPLLTDNEEIHFHIILFCLWWVANNDEGIKDYYKGINEAIKTINEQKTEIQFDTIHVSKQTDSNFESIINNLFNKNFIVYDQQMAKHFCQDEKQTTYPDCGETTMRNLINLLSLDGGNFNIGLLEKFNPIAPLKEFYKKFDTAEKQSRHDSLTYEGSELNARDAWSKLIIEHANHNVQFLHSCNHSRTHKYEMNAGMSVDEKTPNFFQLLQNLLPGVTEWDDLYSENIEYILDDTTKGVGNIEITHATLGKVTIHLKTGHYFMTISNKTKNDTLSYNNLTDRQTDIVRLIKDDINFLNSRVNARDDDDEDEDDEVAIHGVPFNSQANLTEDNYLHFTFFPSEKLEAAISYTQKMKKFALLKKLVTLSSTSKYDSDLRRRIVLDTDIYHPSELFGDDSSTNAKMNEYTYTGINFEFLNNLPGLTCLNFKLKSNPVTIDLSPLKNIEIIGDGFLSGATNLASIDLSPLKNVKIIHPNFMRVTTNLKTIDLSPLKKVEEIGIHFMSFSSNLKTIESCNLPKLKHIPDFFLSYSYNLQTIKSLSLGNVESIGDVFFRGCRKLKSIDLSSLKKVKTIGEEFLENTPSLESLDMSHMKNLTKIDDDFLRASGVKTVNFSSLENLKEIGTDFLSDAKNLETLDLSSFINVEKMLPRGLSGLGKLKSIRLDMPKLRELPESFLSGAENLQTVDLCSMRNLETIGSYVLSGAFKLKFINLSGLNNVTTIGSEFMAYNTSLSSIYLDPLRKLKQIGPKFLKSCTSLKKVDISMLKNLTSLGDEYLDGTDAKLIYTENQRHLIHPYEEEDEAVEEEDEAEDDEAEEVEEEK